MKKIILVMLGLSVGLMADFVRDANTKIVSDSTTKLEWQDDAIGKVKTWQSAIDGCENLTLDGNGWRLPNINELKSIIDKGRVNPAIVNAFTQTETTYYYWSSTPYEGYEDGAWVVDFYDGSARSNYKGTTLYVRCVRGEE